MVFAFGRVLVIGMLVPSTSLIYAIALSLNNICIFVLPFMGVSLGPFFTFQNLSKLKFI